jgi:hypothetical protein
MRLMMGLAAALTVTMSGGTVYAKMVMRTFPVPQSRAQSELDQPA